MARPVTYSKFTFPCRGHLWRFWERVLPRVAYAKAGASHHDLINEAILFVCECMDPSRFDDEKQGKPYHFRRDVWNAMTGFEDILSAAYASSEELEGAVTNLQTRSIYVEAGIRARKDYPKGAKKDIMAPPLTEDELCDRESFPSCRDTKSIKTPFLSALAIEQIREAVEASGAKYMIEQMTAEVKIQQKAMILLTPLLEFYSLKPSDAIRTIMELVQLYLPLVAGYSDSLPEDLIARKLACENLAINCLEVFEKLLESCEASSYYALLIAERLSTLGHELNTGETLLDKVLSQKTVREDPNTSYTEHTELEQAERLWGEHLL